MMKTAPNPQQTLTGMMTSSQRATDLAKMIVEMQCQWWQQGVEVCLFACQNYLRTLAETGQRVSEQSMIFRGEMSRTLEQNILNTQEILMDEQRLALEAAEAFQAQWHAASEQTAQVYLKNGQD